MLSITAACTFILVLLVAEQRSSIPVGDTSESVGDSMESMGDRQQHIS